VGATAVPDRSNCRGRVGGAGDAAADDVPATTLPTTTELKVSHQAHRFQGLRITPPSGTTGSGTNLVLASTKYKTVWLLPSLMAQTIGPQLPRNPAGPRVEVGGPSRGPQEHPRGQSSLPRVVDHRAGGTPIDYALRTTAVDRRHALTGSVAVAWAARRHLI
jgi:hypothetical protein